MAGKTLPPIEYLRQIIDYNPETGALTWKDGRPAFGDSGHGYLSMSLRRNGSRFKFYAHRVAWAISYNEWPEVIDHMNGNRKDNRLCNLRSVSTSINGRNAKRRADNTSGANGVHYHKSRRKWIAYIDTDGSRTYLGYFTAKDEAVAARKRADASNGFTARHGGD